MFVWTDEADAKLKRLYRKLGGNLSASWTARALGDGVNRNMVIGRTHRILKTVFACDIERQKKRERECELRQVAQSAAERRYGIVLTEIGKCGVDRDSAILAAASGNVPYRQIGEHFGISKQRVHQIIGRFA